MQNKDCQRQQSTCCQYIWPYTISAVHIIAMSSCAIVDAPGGANAHGGCPHLFKMMQQPELVEPSRR